jgi:hypothetical protein
MQMNPRQIVTQFAHILQEELFPVLESFVGPVSGQMQLLASVISMAPLERHLSARRAATGRPAKDRAAPATAFMAKAILNIPTTRDLISRLRVDQALRQFCGCGSVKAVPHESKFSRAFAEFAGSELPQQLHESVIAATQKDRLIGHIARDSTAIPARESFSREAQENKKEKKDARQRRSNALPKPPSAERASSGSGIRNCHRCCPTYPANATLRPK